MLIWSIFFLRILNHLKRWSKYFQTLDHLHLLNFISKDFVSGVDGYITPSGPRVCFGEKNCQKCHSFENLEVKD